MAAARSVAFQKVNARQLLRAKGVVLQPHGTHADVLLAQPPDGGRVAGDFWLPRGSWPLRVNYVRASRQLIKVRKRAAEKR